MKPEASQGYDTKHIIVLFFTVMTQQRQINMKKNALLWWNKTNGKKKSMKYTNWRNECSIRGMPAAQRSKVKTTHYAGIPKGYWQLTTTLANSWLLYQFAELLRNGLGVGLLKRPIPHESRLEKAIEWVKKYTHWEGGGKVAPGANQQEWTVRNRLLDCTLHHIATKQSSSLWLITCNNSMQATGWLIRG